MAASTMETGLGNQLAGQAKSATEQARQRVNERFDTQKSSVTREAKGIARALRNTAEQCEGQDQAFIANYARRAADGIERLGEVLDRKDLPEMMKDLERVCRERPLLVGGAALLAGFLGARVARTAASSGHREIGEGRIEGDVEIAPAEGGI